MRVVEVGGFEYNVDVRLAIWQIGSAHHDNNNIFTSSQYIDGLSYYLVLVIAFKM